MQHLAEIGEVALVTLKWSNYINGILLQHVYDIEDFT